MSFSKYISQFSKNVNDEQTHLSFNKGKYNVPDNKLEEFYKNYYNVIKEKGNPEKDSLFLIEKVYNSNFAFFLDLDIKNEINITDNDIIDIIELTKESIKNMFEDNEMILEYIVSKRITENNANYHINFYNLIVNNAIGKKLTMEILSNNNILSNELKKCIDMSVYRTGLRLLGSKKVSKENKENKEEQMDIYKIYDLNLKKFTELHETEYLDFIKTTVKRKRTILNTPLKNKNIEKENTLSIGNKSVPVKGVSNDKIIAQLKKLLQHIKLENDFLQNFDISIARIYANQNKMGIFCYYVSINGKYCPFKERNHKRDSSPIYFEINTNGIYIKCYDEECLRRKFPEEGIKLPNNFAEEYSDLYLSMNTKYWHSDITITNEIRDYLEASLLGSHYQIAKAVFQIYKDRFRIDDIKNTEWYEFDGIRWKQSHLMNILISEDLPKYYRGIKISDTSSQTKDLQDFLVNNDKIDANVRNGMIDNIIAKLENVSFKNNIISQVTYLFKTYDPEFYSNLDSDNYLLGFKNGVYDFNTNKFRNGTQNDYITFSTGYDYIEYDESYTQINEIYDFLGKIITNRKVLEYTLKILGKSLIGMPDERFYIWTGLSGANGKSTLINFLEHTLGDYITSVDVSLLTNKRANASNASPDVVRLRGKRLFTFQEPEHDDKLRTGILKQYTGGDTIIARELFKAPVCFKLQGTMVMCCNELPSVTSCDGGTWRRIRVIDFTSRFCDNPVKKNEFKIDPTIKYKIKNWRPYFMSILIHWYNKFLTEGMNEPDEVKKATAKYKVDNDKFNEFFDQIIEESDSNFETNKTIHNHFSSWWSNNYPSTRIPEMKDLRRSMKTKYGSEKEKSVNGIMQYGFNIKLRHGLINNDLEEEDDL